MSSTDVNVTEETQPGDVVVKNQDFTAKLEISDDPWSDDPTNPRNWPNQRKWVRLSLSLEFCDVEMIDPSNRQQSPSYADSSQLFYFDDTFIDAYFFFSSGFILHFCCAIGEFYDGSRVARTCKKIWSACPSTLSTSPRLMS
jgi:hypothetical protein